MKMGGYYRREQESKWVSLKVVTMQKVNLMVFAIYSKVLLNFICLRCQNFERKQRQPEGNLFTFFHSFRAIYLAKGNFI